MIQPETRRLSSVGRRPGWSRPDMTVPRPREAVSSAQGVECPRPEDRRYDRVAGDPFDQRRGRQRSTDLSCEPEAQPECVTAEVPSRDHPTWPPAPDEPLSPVIQACCRGTPRRIGRSVRCRRVGSVETPAGDASSCVCDGRTVRSVLGVISGWRVSCPRESGDTDEHGDDGSRYVIFHLPSEVVS